MIATIVLLPNARWCMEVNGQRSQPARYEEPIRFAGAIGWTDYYSTLGGEQVIELGKTIVHKIEDETI